MTQPPDDADEPLGGSLTPQPEDQPPGSGDDSEPNVPPHPPSYPPPPSVYPQQPEFPPPGYPQQPAFPPPPYPQPGSAGTGAGGFPPPPPPSGSFPPPATAYPTGQPVGFPPPPPGVYNPPFPPGPGTGYGQKPHRGTAVLVLGILGILCCFPLSFVAFVMARSDMAAMNAGTMDPSGRQLTNVGRILGIVGIVYAIVQIILIAMNWDTIMSDISTNSSS